MNCDLCGKEVETQGGTHMRECAVLLQNIVQAEEYGLNNIYDLTWIILRNRKEIQRLKNKIKRKDAELKKLRKDSIDLSWIRSPEGMGR